MAEETKPTPNPSISPQTVACGCFNFTGIIAFSIGFGWYLNSWAISVMSFGVFMLVHGAFCFEKSKKK
jgi:hypothetical protein